MEPVALLLALAASSTSATGGRPAFDLDLRLDLPVLAVAGAVSFGWVLSEELAPPHCAPDRCRIDDVLLVDRWAAGQYEPTWRTISNVGSASLLALSAAVLVIDEGPVNAAQDAVVVAQSVLISNAIGVMVELAARRPRPLVYSERAPVDEIMRGNSALSFFSGHTAGAFAVTWAMFAALERLHPDSAIPYVALAVGLTAASFIGVSRVIAGDHFPTDVLIGAAVGTSVGIVVPSLHGAPAQVVGSYDARTGAGSLGLSLVW